MFFTHIALAILGGALIGFLTITGLNIDGFKHATILTLIISLVTYYCTVLAVFNSQRQPRILAAIVLAAVTIVANGYFGIMYAQEETKMAITIIALMAYLLYFGLLEAILRLYAPLPKNCKAPAQ